MAPHTVVLLDDIQILATRGNMTRLGSGELVTTGHFWRVAVSDNVSGQTVSFQLNDTDYGFFLALCIDGDNADMIDSVGKERYARFEALFAKNPECRPFP